MTIPKLPEISTRTITVQFRGEAVNAVIDSDSGYDPETNTRELDWHFELNFRALTPDEHDALKLTDAEEQAIYEQLCLANDES